MNIEEFKSLNSRSEKMKTLLKYFDISDPILIGTIGNKIDNKIWINEIHSIDGEYILNNPFNELKELSVSLNIRDEVIDIDYKDKVYFKFDVNRNEDILGVYPIVTNVKNIGKLIDINDSKLSLKEEIIDRLKRSNIKENVTKVLIQDEVEKELIAITKDTKKILKDIELRVKEVSEELKEKERLKKVFEKYGFSFENDKVNIAKEEKLCLSKENHIEYIQSYLASREEKPLYYSKEILEQFYAGLCTNQLVVLSGQPGTGKTSLVEGFCNAIGAKLKIISVQPNWTDNQDLLGFFNPIEGTYISTPFLDSIIEAENNPEQLHIICLDEMNLAHVEYYFSEFLSKLQSEDNIITLYSKNLYEEAREEIFSKIELFTNKREEDALNVEEGISLLKNIDINEYYKLKKQWRSINKYKNEFKIPSNIRFVGTINKDETTKSLSPKVVDRSYIMEINPYSIKLVEDLKSKIENDRIECKENLYLKANCFKRNTKILSKKLKEELNALEVLLRKFDITLTNRIRQQVNELYGSEIISENNIFDAIVTAKILPKISVEIDFENESLINDFEKSLSNTIIAKSIFSKMISYWKQCGILTFWR